MKKNKEDFLEICLRSQSELKLFDYENDIYKTAMERKSSKFKSTFPIGAFLASLPILFLGGLIVYSFGMLIYEFVLKNI